MPNMNISRNKELLNNLVESQARERMKSGNGTENSNKSSNKKSKKSSSKASLQHNNNNNNNFTPPKLFSLHEMSQQTSQPWLPAPKPNSNQFSQPNILRDPTLCSPMAKGKNKYRNKTWKQRFQMEVLASSKRKIQLQEEITDMNIREAKLRDQRDKQAKKLYEFATVDCMLMPDLANVYGELSRNQATISSHHEALLNRIDARTCQELELIPDLVEQIKTQLDVYCKTRAEFDSEQRKANLGANSGSWLAFFQPSSPRFNPGAAMNPGGYSGGYNNYGNNNFNPNRNSPFSNPERAPSQLHILAKKCKESLTDLEELVDRYYTQIFEHIKKSLQMMAKAYIEYHTSCLEIFTKQWNDMEEFKPSKAALGFCESLGFNDLKKEVEQHIRQTSNTGMLQQFMDNQRREMEQQNMMQPWQMGMNNSPWKNNGMGGGASPMMNNGNNNWRPHNFN